MRKTLLAIPAILFLLTSCVKEYSNLSASSTGTAPGMPIPKGGATPQVVQPPGYAELISVNNGEYYQANWKTLSIQVYPYFTYRTLDDFNNPLPPRNGDFLWPTQGIMNVGPDAMVTYAGTQLPYNQFVITQGIFSAGAGDISGDISNFETASNTAWSTYQTQLQAWIGTVIGAVATGQYNVPTAPVPNMPFISTFFTAQSMKGGAGFVVIPGKFIRIDHGSTFAIADLSYPVPPDPPPATCSVCIYCQAHPDDPNCP